MSLDAVRAALAKAWAAAARWLAPLLAWFAGRKAERDERAMKETKDALAKEREINDRLRDPDNLDRLRERFRRRPPGADD